ncbi:ribokinase [Hirschia baltica]|uniref:ribokinase n=1 Tax=Hirschia baltica TaxID=2724 RepID=UPI0003138B57|nr:ribokinase [Hirschia baltica]
MGKLSVIGSVNLDVVATVENLPRPGETVIASSLEYFLGGKGANQAVAAQKVGVETVFYACIGDDSEASFLVDNLTKVGVDVAQVKTKSKTFSGRAYINVDHAGENEVVVLPGANAELEFDESKLDDATAVALAQLETAIEPTVQFFKSCQKKHAMTILNAAPFVAEARLKLFELSDIIIVNEVELAGYCGVDEIPEDVEDIILLLRSLISRNDQAVIVTCGAAGALCVHGKDVIVVAARFTQVVDSTGAGDCFSGVLAAGIVQGLSLKEALQRASIASSLSVESKGASASSPFLADIEAEIQKNQITEGAET